MKYKDWLEEWLDNYVEPTAKAKTFNRYSEIVYKHIIPKFGEYELNELNVSELQRYITELLQCGNIRTGKGLAVNSVNGVINVLQNSLKTAHFLGYTEEFIANKIKRPKTKEKSISCFTLQEQKKIEQAIINGKKEKMFGILLCFYTGLRVGELLALKWGNIDLYNGYLTISSSCRDGKNNDGKFMRFEDSPKTQSSLRTIPLPKQLIPVLKCLRNKSCSDYFVSNGNKPVSVRSYQESFNLLLKKIKIPHRGFHSIRHTFATRALECGMDVKTLSEVLGHKSPTVTLNRYAHSLLEHKKEMMNRLGKFFQ